MSELKVGGIIVLYNPDLSLLKKVVDNIKIQLLEVCLIDNSSTCMDSDFLLNYKTIKYIPLYKNVGIAEAQNIGLKYFTYLNFDYILFVDQDSILPVDLVKRLFVGTTLLVNNGFNVAALCPISVNRQDGRPYKQKYPVLDSFSLINLNDTYNFLKVNSCGSSASLISIKNFETVGLMDGSLFIDGVDNEWCWRAKSICNLDTFILQNVAIDHQLGEGDRSFLGFKFAVATPFRVYYQFRNFIILCKRDYVPMIWKVKNGYKYFIKFFVFPLFVSPRFLYLKRIIIGIKDGFKA